MRFTFVLSVLRNGCDSSPLGLGPLHRQQRWKGPWFRDRVTDCQFIRFGIFRVSISMREISGKETDFLLPLSEWLQFGLCLIKEKGVFAFCFMLRVKGVQLQRQRRVYYVDVVNDLAKQLTLVRLKTCQLDFSSIAKTRQSTNLSRFNVILLFNMN